MMAALFYDGCPILRLSRRRSTLAWTRRQGWCVSLRALRATTLCRWPLTSTPRCVGVASGGVGVASGVWVWRLLYVSLLSQLQRCMALEEKLKTLDQQMAMDARYVTRVTSHTVQSPVGCCRYNNYIEVFAFPNIHPCRLWAVALMMIQCSMRKE